MPVNAVTRSPWTPAVNPSFSQAPPMQRGEGEGAFIPEESRNTAISRHRLPDTPEINLWAKQHVGPGHRASAMGGMQVVIRPKISDSTVRALFGSRRLGHAATFMCGWRLGRDQQRLVEAEEKTARAREAVYSK